MGILKQGVGCSPQTDDKVLLLKAEFIQPVEYGEFELVSTLTVHHYVPVSLVQEGTLHATNGET